MKNIVKSAALFACLGCIFSCQNRTQTATVISPQEQNLPLNVNCENVKIDSACFLGTDLLNQLLPMLKHYDGIPPHLAFSLPQLWTAECKLPTFSPDFDIWVVSDISEQPLMKVLITINHDPQPIIIQAVPIALNLGNEKQNTIESEVWTATIDETYNVLVTKKYEKIYSLTDSTKHLNNISTTKEDMYTIESLGTLSYTPQMEYDIDYEAIIQFADTAVIGKITEDNWELNALKIQNTAQEYDIIFMTVYRQFDKISIRNHYGEEIDIVDITPFIERHTTGYIALKKGETPLYIPYCSDTECFAKAMPYFDIEYWDEEE
ncbi:MAG: hypothetical protein LBR36_08085 [Bacteroidales bacterium]|jgi:hypothetical protein|nr:hypothetical protein [Bacteroidales bacterium]